jgi:hypothetical protein
VAFYHYLIHEKIIQKDELDAYFKDQETNTQVGLDIYTHVNMSFLSISYF